MNTISQIRFSGEGIIPEPVEEQVVKTIQGAGAMNEAVQEKTSLFTEAIELLRNSYLEEKAHIEQELETPVTE
ncbi:hypothetical protein HQ487_01680 [Candidatus Uhrbacteria bacterium]|nr:hypothetical protein [Candidatus Uhrbacteria bacterium]